MDLRFLRWLLFTLPPSCLGSIGPPSIPAIFVLLWLIAGGVSLKHLKHGGHFAARVGLLGFLGTDKSLGKIPAPGRRTQPCWIYWITFPETEILTGAGFEDGNPVVFKVTVPFAVPIDALALMRMKKSSTHCVPLSPLGTV